MNAVNQSTKGINQRRMEAANAGRRKVIHYASVLLLLGLCMAAGKAYHSSRHEKEQAVRKSQGGEPAAAPSQAFVKKFLFGMIADDAPASRRREIQDELGWRRKAMADHASLAHQLNWKRYIVDDAQGDGFYAGMEPDRGRESEAAAAPPPAGDEQAATMNEGDSNSPDGKTAASSQVSVVAAALDEQRRDKPSVPEQAMSQQYATMVAATMVAAALREREQRRRNELPAPEQAMPQQYVTMMPPLAQGPSGLDEARSAVVRGHISMPENRPPQQTGSPAASAPQPMPADHSQKPEYAVLEQADAVFEDMPVISTVAVEAAPFAREAAQENGSCDEIIRSMDAAVLDDFYYAIGKLRRSQTVLKGTGGSVYRVMPTSIRGRCMEYDVQAEIGGIILLCRDTACMGG